MSKKTFKVAVSWEVCGEVVVQAETLDEAFHKVENDDSIPLPDGDYIDGSFQADYGMSQELNDEGEE